MLPELPLAAWEPTKQTLHLWLQIVGKMKLSATPKRNHWWHAAFQPGVRGLTTGRMRLHDTAFAIDFDFLAHELRVRAADGRTESFPLEDGLSVAHSTRSSTASLGSLGLDVEILEEPFGVPMTTPFPEDAEHASYDREYVERFWRVLDFSAARLDEFAGRFHGKQSPTHVFWHSLRPGTDAVLRALGHAAAGRRQRHAGGVLGGGDLVRLLGGRRADPGAVLLLVHRAGARGSDRAAARAGARPG